jgi:hypothetical protein
MKRLTSGYTGGEIAALIAPLFSLDAEEIEHAAIIVLNDDGTIAMVGCAHAEELAKMVVIESETHKWQANRADDSGPNNVGSIHSRLARWARSWMGS